MTLSVFSSLDEGWRDLRFAVRSLARTPGFTSIALLAIAVGISVNTAVFSAVDAVLLKSLTYPDSSPPMTFPRTTVAWRLLPRSAGLSSVIVDFFGTTSVHLSERKVGLLVPKSKRSLYRQPNKEIHKDQGIVSIWSFCSPRKSPLVHGTFGS